MVLKETYWVVVLCNSVKIIKTIINSHCLMHFVAKSVQKWTVYALIQYGKIEGKSVSWRAASIITKIVNGT